MGGVAIRFRRLRAGAAALGGAVWLGALHGCGGGSPAAGDDAGSCAQASCVRIVELWSAQFDGVRRNGFSETANATDAGAQSEAGRYLLIGARADGLVRVSTRVANPGAVAGLVLQ